VEQRPRLLTVPSAGVSPHPGLPAPLRQLHLATPPAGSRRTSARGSLCGESTHKHRLWGKSLPLFGVQCAACWVFVSLERTRRATKGKRHLRTKCRRWRRPPRQEVAGGVSTDALLWLLATAVPGPCVLFVLCVLLSSKTGPVGCGMALLQAVVYCLCCCTVRWTLTDSDPAGGWCGVASVQARCAHHSALVSWPLLLGSRLSTPQPSLRFPPRLQEVPLHMLITD